MFTCLMILCAVALVVVLFIKGTVFFGILLRAVAMPPVCAVIGAFVGVCCNVFFGKPWDADTLVYMFGFIGACVGIYAMICEIRDAWYA